MAKRILAVLVMLGILCFSITALAMEPDARSYAMGGAYTAVVKDASAVYWNPAMLPYIRYTSLVLGGGVASDDVQAISDAMNQFNNEEYESLNIDVNGQAAGIAALSTRWFGFGFYGNINLDAQAKSELVDQENIDPDNLPENLGSADGFMAANVRADAALAMAKRFNRFSLGLAVKGVSDSRIEQATYTYVPVPDGITPDPQPVNNDVQIQRIGTGISSDLAFATSFTDRLRLGVVVQDIFSSMEYESETWVNNVSNGKEQKPGKLDSVVRAGVALEPGFGFTLAGDVTSEGQIGLGLEKNLFWNGLSLRGGYVSQDDLQEYRAGLGLNLLWLHLDVGVGMSPENGVSGAMLNASLTF